VPAVKLYLGQKDAGAPKDILLGQLNRSLYASFLPYPHCVVLVIQRRGRGALCVRESETDSV
jgi:hypothetical protein